MKIGADLDGTILHHPGKVDFWDEVSLAQCYPDLLVVRNLEARVAASRGSLAVITGRTEAVRFVTESQVHGILGPVPVFMQREWLGWDALIEWKATTLIDQGIDLYVGDLQADEAAARMAGCSFTNVADWTSRRAEAA